MIAGLPNSIGKVAVFVIALTTFFALALPGLADDVQTPSTTLDDVLTIITQNKYLSPTQETLLTSSLTSAITSGALTPDQALAFVDLSGLENVTDATETPLLTHALSIILDAVVNGDIDPDQASTYLADAVASGTLSALKDLAESETPMGIENSISNLGASEDYDQEGIDIVLAKVDELVAAGVPAGIALRVARELIRTGIDPEDIVAELDRLESSIVDDGSSPGKAANEVTPEGQNQNQNQEEEMNQNSNNGKNDEPENENEENQNGSSGNGKSNGSPKNGNSNSGSGNSGGNSSNGKSGNAGTNGGKG